jgi:hypothetical protein
MSEKQRPPVSTSRRTLLSAFAGTGVGAALASLGGDRADRPESTRRDRADPRVTNSTGDLLDAVSLGTFESGLDGWQADGEIELSRVTRSDRPVAVTEGRHALDASVGGESVPAIARPVESLTLADRPYFVADVAPGRAEGTDAPVAFQFRLYRPADLLDGDLELVAESDPITVRQAAPGRIFWDASDVDSDLLDVTSRLEIAWWPADSTSGDSDDGSAYRGTVVLDAIRATTTVDPVGSARLAATMRDLQFDHGPYERTEVVAASQTDEEGDLIFANGEAEPYRFEVLGDDRFRLTLAGTEVKLGGGWS